MLTRPKWNTIGIEIKANSQDLYKFTDRPFNWANVYIFLGPDAGAQRNEIPSPIAYFQWQRDRDSSETKLDKLVNVSSNGTGLLANKDLDILVVTVRNSVSHTEEYTCRQTLVRHCNVRDSHSTSHGQTILLYRTTCVKVINCFFKSDFLKLINTERHFKQKHI